MNRTTVAVVAALIALVFLAGTGSVGFTAASELQQSETLNISVWLSPMDSMDPARRLDPETAEARAVIQSNLKSNDPREYRIVLRDAGGIQMFQSARLTLPEGDHAETVTISGQAVFQGYVSSVESHKGEVVPAIDAAIAVMEEERAKDPCAESPTDRTQTSRVIDRINQALGVRELVDNPVGQLLSFDSLEAGARTDLEAARTALAAVSTNGSAAMEKLEVPEGAPRCDEVDAPNWEPDWDAVEADLNAMKAQATTSVNEIDSALDTVDREMDRNFPSTAVAEQCNQNTVQLRVAGTDSPTDDFWFTVGTPGAASKISNPEEPSNSGDLLSRPTRIYSTEVDVADVPQSSTVEALVLDDFCLPVPDVTVDFSTPTDSVVQVDTPQVTTDANGVAKATISSTAQVGDGTATVNATVGSALASVGLTVIGPPAPGWLRLRLGGAEVERVPNYGATSSVQVSAIVKDTNGNNVANGTSVRFSIEPSGDHSFVDGGEVTTASGQANANLVLGAQRGFYTVRVESGDVGDSQALRVVGPPAQIEATADPIVILVNTPVVDKRTSQLTVSVKDAQEPPAPAPDSTVVEFEFLNPDDADWAYFPTLTQVGRGIFQTTNLDNGETSATMVANSGLVGFHTLRLRVTATYTFGGEVRGSASDELTIVLRGDTGETVFLPLIGRNSQ